MEEPRDIVQQLFVRKHGNQARYLSLCASGCLSHLASMLGLYLASLADVDDCIELKKLFLQSRRFGLAFQNHIFDYKF